MTMTERKYNNNYFACSHVISLPLGQEGTEAFHFLLTLTSINVLCRHTHLPCALFFNPLFPIGLVISPPKLCPSVTERLWQLTVRHKGNLFLLQVRKMKSPTRQYSYPWSDNSSNFEEQEPDWHVTLVRSSMTSRSSSWTRESLHPLV